MLRKSVRTALTSALAAGVVAALPAAAAATFVPGPNGKIAFASGRASSGIPTPAGDDSDARIWVADYPSGIPQQVTTLPAGTQHRHPNWSPDHTKIVYSAGAAFSGRYALWIVDLNSGLQSEFAPAADGQDRPSWSPDGTRIAYGSGGHLFVKDVAGGSSPVQLTRDALPDERPVWSPDGTTLYFDRGPRFTRAGSGDKDIWKKTPVTPEGVETRVTGTRDVDDWQPALSPDGRRLCFLSGGQDSTADLYTVSTDGLGVTPFSLTAGVGDLNCVWSPDGTRVLYTLGAFGTGELATKDVNGHDPQTLTSMNVASHFDGNADWATNFSPVCDARDASVVRNGFVTIALACVDPDFGAGATPPTALPLESDALALVRQPSHGNVGSISNGRVIYTPAKDFAGTDTFTYTASDDLSSGTDADATTGPATVTVHVTAARDGGRGTTTDRTPPTISRIAVSPRRWRLGSVLPHVARTRAAARVGTTISFQLSEAGRATLAFQRASSGRRVGGRCVKRTRANSSARRCTRFVRAGSVAGLAAKAGANRIGFQGRLDRSRRLTLGTYRVLVSAQDAAGNPAGPRTGPTFTIVAH